jgi:16S rRNA processing protein RimM
LADAERICLGRIVGAHGLDGSVLVRSYTAEPGAIGTYGALSDERGERSFELKVRRVTAKGVVARLAGVADRTAAEKLKGIDLYVARSALPEAEEDEFYYTDLVGLAVQDRDGTRIGSVARIDNYGAGDVIEVNLDAGGALLLPFTRQVVLMVDVAGRRITVDPPAETEGTE